MTKTMHIHKTIKRAVLMLTLISSSVATELALAQDVVLDSIRAVVNEGVVLDSDIASAIRFYKQQAASNQQSLPADDVLATRVLEELIDRKVQRQRAKEIGVAIDANGVNRAIDQISRSNNMSAIQFRKTLQQQGYDYDLFRENIEQELLEQRLIEREVQPRIRVSAQEIDDFIEGVKGDAEDQLRYRIQHILIAIASSANSEEVEAATNRANGSLAKLRAGADFATEAAASSDGARALQGGDLGWRTLQELPNFLSNALRKMKPSDIGGPLRSANGLHLIKMVERQTNDQTQLEESLVRHIFLAGDEANVKQKLITARQRLAAGESFDQLAAQISEDPNSANSGGELPWFSSGQMPKEIEDMAKTLKVNQLSQPFRTQFGWHLMELLDQRTRSIGDDALREQANNSLRQNKIEQETQRWLRQLRDESFVEIRS
ncbi:MAG: peptidyl-prolyl cis-trans isomerase SurA [Porticoccaceae bacterium]|jgi:peptidyl-prolyl cis-trans isomerase SurA